MAILEFFMTDEKAFKAKEANRFTITNIDQFLTEGQPHWTTYEKASNYSILLFSFKQCLYETVNDLSISKHRFSKNPQS